jgi:adenylate kinase family enzyme
MERYEGVVLAVAGKPCSSKGTVTKRILELVPDAKVLEMSTEIKRVKDFDPKRWQELKLLMDAGELAPDSITIPAFYKSWAALNNPIKIVDGFPRNVEQAKVLIKQAKDAKHLLILLVIEVSDELARERNAYRRSQESRDDDDVRSFENRLRVYQVDTEPAINHLHRHGVMFKPVDGRIELPERVNLCMDFLFEHVSGLTTPEHAV